MTMTSSSASNIHIADSSGPSPGTATVSETPATASDLSSLWSQAFHKYHDKTGIDPRTHALTKNLANCSTVDEIMHLFDTKMQEFKTFRVGDPNSKWIKLRNDYLKPAVKVVLCLNDAFAETAAYFPVVPGGKAIFVAFGALLLATDGMSKRYDALIDLFEEIPFFLDSVRVRESNPQSWGPASKNIAAAILAHLLEVMALAFTLMKPSSKVDHLQRIVHFGQSLAGNTDMQDALRRLRRLTNLEIRAITSELRVEAAESLKITKALMGDLAAMDIAYSNHFTDLATRLQDEHTEASTERALAAEERAQATEERSRAEAARTREQQELGQIRHTQAHAAANAALDRLDRLDKADLAAQTRSACLPGTRIKLLADLSAWSRNPDGPRTYWLNGMAGTGKSAIARSFGEHLRDHRLLGGSFFCSRESDAELKDSKRIVPTLAATLAALDSGYKLALMPVLEKYSAESRPSTWGLREQVVRLFCEPFASGYAPHMPSYILIIDALDETSDMTVEELLKALIDRSADIPVRFFLTSRPEEHIQQGLRTVEKCLQLHDIEKDIVEADIQCYVAHRMQNVIAEFDHLDLPLDWPSPDDVSSLAALAGVLFIHAFTTTEYIRGRGGNPVDRLQSVLKLEHNPRRF
ncbi:unnamed protein product [Peniophora sp. CBMAI 1063]|nr:unnamed protein product [Peniophora sp. CBMAI 1063]